MILVALLAGYVVGSIPSAELLGRMWGVDLRRGGSGNPGANNARRLGGMGLATVVLLVEMAKGVAAVLMGLALAGSWGAVLAGLGAIAGNVYNVWYRFQGGKGLGITAGVVLAMWPAAFLPIIVVIGIAALITRSTGKGALVAMAALNLFALLWVLLQIPQGPWGIVPGIGYLVLSVGATLILFRKHLEDAIRPASLLETRERA